VHFATFQNIYYLPECCESVLHSLHDTYTVLVFAAFTSGLVSTPATNKDCASQWCYVANFCQRRLFSDPGGDTLTVLLVIRFTTVPIPFNFCILHILFWYPFSFGADECSGYMSYRNVQIRRGHLFEWNRSWTREGGKMAVWKGKCYFVWMREMHDVVEGNALHNPGAFFQ